MKTNTRVKLNDPKRKVRRSLAKEITLSDEQLRQVSGQGSSTPPVDPSQYERRET